MRIFITGSTGFIGKHLVKNLKKTHHRLLLLNSRLEDIKKWQDEVMLFKPTVAIHLAWEGIPDYGVEQSIKNLQYGLDLFKILIASGCRKIISTGSCWEYGQNYGSLNENLGVKPKNAFTAAKNALCWFGKALVEKANIQFIWTRLFFVYGPGQRQQSLIPYLITCINNKKKIEINNPFAQNDFIYINDVIEALTKLLNNEKINGIYNIGSGKTISVGEIIEIVYNQLGIKDHYISPVVNNKKLVDNFRADIRKIKRDTGWKPRTNIEKGIRETINYLLKNKRDE